ncbi:MAG: hypothetical protein QW470_07460 [Candidatus Caldarchaeum sp.]
MTSHSKGSSRAFCRYTGGKGLQRFGKSSRLAAAVSVPVIKPLDEARLRA